MMTPLRNFIRNEDGVGTVDGLIWTVAGLMIASVAIDGSYAWRTQTQLQTAADASALAAAAYIPAGNEAAKEMSMKVAGYNVPTSTGGALVQKEDIVFGYYTDADGFRQTDDFNHVNAAHVTVNRIEARGTQLRTLLMGLVGKEQFDVGAQAIAVYDTDALIALCEHGGLISHSYLQMEGADDVSANYCLHGESGVWTGAGSLFDSTIQISAKDLASLQIGGFGPNTVTTDDITYERSAATTTIELAAGYAEKLQEHFSTTSDSEIKLTEWSASYPFEIFDTDLISVPVFSSSGTWVVDNTTLKSNAIYYHKGDVLVPWGTDFSKVALIIDGTIQHVSTVDDPTTQIDTKPGTGTAGNTNAWVEYSDSLIVADQMSLTGAVNAGFATSCGTTDFDSFFLSSGTVDLGSDGMNVSLNAVFMYATGDIISNGGIMGAANRIENRGRQRHLGGTQLWGCNTVLGSPFVAPFSETAKITAARLVY